MIDDGVRIDRAPAREDRRAEEISKKTGLALRSDGMT
jgi:hypothetical protein